MNTKRFEKLISHMKEEHLSQMIISDPVAIFYFTGLRIEPGERLLALYVHENGAKKLVINELFPQKEISGLDFIWINDTQDGLKPLVELCQAGQDIGIDKNWPARFLLSLQEALPKHKYRNGSILVDDVRRIKDEAEQAALRESSRINDQVMATLIPWVVKGLTEKELSDKVKEIYADHGITRLSFEPITAYGKGGADPHHVTDDSKGTIGDGVVLDIGGFYKDYASDMTRTVFIGQVSEKAREVYEIVKEANLRGIAMAKPGNRMADVDLACRNYIEEKGYGPYFTHRTGHSIGLEDHEAGDVSSVNEAIIQPGQCFSVEPGIYLPEEGIGVRIEDLVLITEDGCEVLNSYSKDLLVVEVD